MKRYLISLALLTGSLFAVGQQINPITQATLDAYKSMLEENPNDYVVYYQRAAQYYQLSMYDYALDDVQRGIRLTPVKEKDTLLREYTLLANIQTEKQNYTAALEAVNSALELSPNDYALLYLKGNTCIHLNLLSEARSAFLAMQRIRSRSQEALTGLAKVDILEGKTSDAKQKMSQLEELNSASATTYCRLGDLYRDLGEPENAAMQYLTGFAISEDNETRAMSSLFDLAEENYNAVVVALNTAISKTTNTLPLYFLKGNVAFENGHYLDAESAFGVLLNTEDGKQATVYNRMASTKYALNKMQDALQYINQAISLEPLPYNYITKAQIELALGDNIIALAMGKKAYDNAKDPVLALSEMALANIALKNYSDALANLNEAIMEDGSNTELIMVRAYLYGSLMNDEKSSRNDYQRAASLTADSVEALANKAIAQAFSGKQLDSSSTLNTAEQKAVSADDYYWLAVAYSQIGSLDKGREMLNKSKSLGYENRYNLEVNNIANLNISPIR
jgi:tetratricopeptide (TPR) repeat protein